MSAWAKPGVKCVCVHNSGWWYGDVAFDSDVGPGKIYTVVEVVTPPSGKVGISLWGQPLGEYYNADCFRPLVTKTQDEDIALFRHYLDQAGVDA